MGSPSSVDLEIPFLATVAFFMVKISPSVAQSVAQRVVKTYGAYCITQPLLYDSYATAFVRPPP